MSRVEQQNGYILLPVVLLISLVATLAFMLNHESAQNTANIGSLAEAKQSEYVAQAGLQHSLQQIVTAGCGPYTDITAEPFGSNTYSSTITPNNVGGTITTYTVAVSDDAFIRQDLSTNNHGSDTKLEIYHKWFAFVERRVLYRFDIATSGIPAGAQVVSAVAKIFVVTPDPSTSVSVHQITADWTEGAVTWDNIADDHDYFSSVASIGGNPPAGQYVEVNITPLVQGWINGSVANQGIMLKPSLLNNNILSEYTSKEYGNTSQRPELVIKVAGGSLSNRADVTATGTLANGVSRTITRTDITLTQPPSSVVWQPGSELEDAFIWNGAHKNKNFGTSPILNIKNDRNVLIRFALEALPPGAQISDAKLGLYLEDGNGVTNGVLDLHALSRDWVEGIYDDVDPATGEGVTYQEYDGGNSWTTPGGDYNAAIIDSITLPTMTPGWYEWEVTDQIQSWLTGTPNYGFLLREAGGDAGDIDFTSSDNTTTPENHPRLTLTFSCECGVACQIPQGSGKILLVIGDDITLAAADSQKKALFEAWGYSVNLINDDADQVTFDAALVNNDVAYISETVWGPTLADKLAGTDKGVVNEEEDQNSRLGLSSSGSNIVNDSMEIIDNSHDITSLFPSGVLPIFSAPMESMLVTGTPAPGLQTLGNFSGTASLALVDGGDTLQGGGTAPGRRVAIPIGSNDKFNWDYLNNNGRLIVQRAIQWAMDADVASPPGPIAHWKLDDASGTIAVDSEGGHDGTLTNSPTWTTGQDGGAMEFDGSNDYVDLTSDTALDDVFLGGATVMAWIRPTGWGESDHGRILDKSSQTSGDRDGWMIAINGDNPSVEIAQGFSGGKGYWRTQAGSFTLNDWVHVAFVYDSSSSANDPVIYLSGIAQSSLVEVPPSGTLRSDASISLRMGNHAQSTSRTFDGKIDDVRIYDRMLDAAEINDIVSGGGSPPPSGSCDGNFRDEFIAKNYSGNVGSLNWATDWLEVGESDGPTSGDEQVKNDQSNYQLRVQDNNNGGEGVEREVDLSGATTASVSFDYRLSGLDNSSDYVSIEISANGSSGPWAQLTQFVGPGDDANYSTFNMDISSYISSNTRIRFVTSPDMGGSDIVWFDNVEIQCSP